MLQNKGVKIARVRNLEIQNRKDGNIGQILEFGREETSANDRRRSERWPPDGPPMESRF